MILLYPPPPKKKKKKKKGFRSIAPVRVTDYQPNVIGWWNFAWLYATRSFQDNIVAQNTHNEIYIYLSHNLMV